MRRLHIGGKERSEGWEILDALERPEVDHVGNAKDLSRFAENSFDVVYASHVMEHFDYRDEIAEVLREWSRVLAPGGMLNVSVPDLNTLAELFLLRESLTIDDRWLIMRMMFGGHVDQYDYHQVGLNEEFLSLYLMRAGFTQIRRVESFGFFNDTSMLKFSGILISCNLEARKPQQAMSPPIP